MKLLQLWSIYSQCFINTCFQIWDFICLISDAFINVQHTRTFMCIIHEYVHKYNHIVSNRSSQFVNFGSRGLTTLNAYLHHCKGSINEPLYDSAKSVSCKIVHACTHIVLYGRYQFLNNVKINQIKI